METVSSSLRPVAVVIEVPLCPLCAEPVIGGEEIIAVGVVPGTEALADIGVEGTPLADITTERGTDEGVSRGGIVNDGSVGSDTPIVSLVLIG